MRLLRLHLLAFSPFTGQVLDFGAAAQRLVLVHGPNEAGKSSALRAMSDLRFGIPQQSRDNFVHPHPQMLLGGEFEDREGRRHSLLRRKGRNATLLLADFARAEPAGDPAPPELQALLSCGLGRDEHDRSFALDHQRLRQGGDALLRGEGEIGAALFEASAGVRSIPQLLKRLDDSARAFFMPGARGSSGRINVALKAFDEHQTAFRGALLRPARWAELFRGHQEAAAALAELERQRDALHARLLLLGELRAVSPLLQGADQAARALEELREAHLLDPEAPERRAAAEAGLLAAREGAAAEAAEAQRLRQRIEAIVPDAAILAVAGAVKRLVAASEAADRHRAELAEAAAQCAQERLLVSALSTRIDPQAAPADVLGRVPAPTQRAALEADLRETELARQAFERHREAVRSRASETAEAAAPPLPAQQACAGLRAAQAELARNDAAMRRLAELPPRLRAAERRLRTCLEDAGLADETAMLRATPLLDARIDAALAGQRRDATRSEERRQRIERIEAALLDEAGNRDRLLDQGAVPTLDDLGRARTARDASWLEVRAAYIDRADSRPVAASASASAQVSSPSLPQAYERAVAEADRVADALAADHERAGRLQSALRTIASLQVDRDTLLAELSDIAAADAARDAAWRAELEAARLPSMPPAELREWQLRLAAARAAAEEWNALRDELEHALALERRLAATLHGAIIATGLAAPAADTQLGTLAAIAAQADEEIRRREKQLDTEAGARVQRERERQRMALQEAALGEALEAAERSLRPGLATLGLAPEAGTQVARARLDELDELARAQQRMRAAEARLQHASDALAVLDAAAAAIAAELGDAAPADLRIYAERLTARLSGAESTAAALALARQSLEKALESQARHERAAEAQRDRLAALCGAASVQSPAELPEAEERSRRRREAQVRLDSASVQLAQASRRAPEQLRALLADLDSAAIDAEEAACGQRQHQLEESLREARRAEEAARLALQAIDGADTAAAEREAMARAEARVRASIPAWVRSRLAHALLAEALGRFRDRAQGPMLAAASGYFARMTGGEFTRLVGDDSTEPPVLLAERRDGRRLPVEGMSEGTRDQLYLALRLAALELRRAAQVDLPLLLDDVLMTSDDRRATLILQALADFAREGQVIVFTHHRHLVELARSALPEDRLAVLEVPAASTPVTQ
ncbi:ATP-binding protein [Quisquiliibacterium transsilvanicum]|uniref:Uncharacterized protein YhaN n=1 Tax=Quisquiliibacterium transsilvanicum TaxID=1549638 RepID=A0A7W8HE37_9BURK|nr:AAA family ATPase [Quisquiliibacterium transsilvanicum]MBB5270379.1 uncharacterized protein YhaN [Quisquiliibacterium transsilvanicum]